MKKLENEELESEWGERERKQKRRGEKSDDTKWLREKEGALKEKRKRRAKAHDTLLPASFRVWQGNRRVDQFN